MPNDVVEMLSRLVACPSVNPGDEARSDSPFGERRIAALLKDLLEGWGAETAVEEISPGRPNLVARLAGRESGRSLMLEAHSDTVQVEDMTISPFEPVVRDNRLYGRGACDAKGAMAAMLAAIQRVLAEDGRPPTDLYFVSTCNEERGAGGARKLMESGFRADAAIVGEPTELKIVYAHKGVCRLRIAVIGVAAHSSDPSLGVNAISMMQKVIAAIDGPVADRLRTKRHPLLGEPTISIGVIRGGVQVNVVPSHCEIEVDRRLLPSESREEACREVLDRLESLKRGDPKFDYTVEDREFYPAYREDVDGPLVCLARKACEKAVGTAELDVAPYAANAGFFKSAGIPCVIFGPGSLRQAHTMDEFVELDQVVRAVDAYVEMIRAF